MKTITKYYWWSTLVLILVSLGSSMFACVGHHNPDNIPILNFLIITIGILLLNFFISGFISIISSL